VRLDEEKITLSNQEKLVGWKNGNSSFGFLFSYWNLSIYNEYLLCLTNWNLIPLRPVFTGAANYIKAFADSTFLLSVLRTFGFIAIVIHWNSA